VASAAGGASVEKAEKSVSLGDVVDVDRIIASGLFDHPEIVAELSKYLPEGPVSAANLKEHIRSPQFRQAVNMFNSALKAGQLEQILQSFGLPASPGTTLSSIEEFLAAVQQQAKDQKEDKMDLSK